MAPVGIWPAACPVPAGVPVALWMDHGVGAAVAAAWLSHGGIPWEALLPLGEPDPPPVGTAPTLRFSPAGPASSPGGWGPAAEAARLRQLAWLVLPLTREQARDVPWRAVTEALAASGVGLYAPFAKLTGLEVARLGSTLGVDVRSTHGCSGTPPCGQCPGCAAHARLLAMVGGDRGGSA